MRTKHTLKQICEILHTADARIAAGATVAQVCQELDISAATYYLWRKMYGHMTPHQIEQFEALRRRSAALAKQVRELSLDNAILKEALDVINSLTPDRKREIIRHVQAKLQVSERRACAALSQPRCTQRYKPQQ